jgi:hypothetical protein
MADMKDIAVIVLAMIFAVKQRSRPGSGGETWRPNLAPVVRWIVYLSLPSFLITYLYWFKLLGYGDTCWSQHCIIPTSRQANPPIPADGTNNSFHNDTSNGRASRSLYVH